MLKNDIDPRVKFLIAILTGLITLWIPMDLLYILVTCLFIYLTIQGYILKGLIYSGLLAILYIITLKTSGLDSPVIRFIQMSTIILIKLLPILMANYPVKKTAPGVLIAALFKLKLPKEIIIPIAVVLRFSPTIANEYKKISESMSLRGLKLNFWGVIKNPIQILEATIIPLFMRSIKVSDELAAAATLRGIENPCKKSCYRDLTISKKDGIIVLSYSLTVFYLVYRSLV